MNEVKKYPRKKPQPGENMISSDDIGKLPPQAVEEEEAVLGAMLLEDSAYHEVADILNPDSFYKESNTRICHAIINLHNSGQACDILTVTRELRRTGELEQVGGAHYISQLTSRLASSANIRFHMMVVLQEFVKREIIRASTARIRDAYETGSDAFEVLDSWEKDLTALNAGLFITKTSDCNTLLKQMLLDNEALTNSGGQLIGVPTGFKDLDRLTGGWQKSDMIVLAARPGMGKTALMLNFARSATEQGHAVTIFSLEMSAVQLFKRLCSQVTDIPQDVILKQGMDKATVNTLLRDMAPVLKANLDIDDTPALTIFELRRKARKLKREKNTGLIIIDYLQLMGGVDEKSNREQEVSRISRGVKALAKELDIAIIALSQLSRQTEGRPGSTKRPMLSDLRESGAIEQDADMVMFIFRPEYYGIETDTSGQRLPPGLAEIIIAKNRHGALDTIELKFIGRCVKFVDFPEEGSAQPQQSNQFPAPAPPPQQPNTDFLEQKEKPKDFPF